MAIYKSASIQSSKKPLLKFGSTNKELFHDYSFLSAQTLAYKGKLYELEEYPTHQEDNLLLLLDAVPRDEKLSAKKGGVRFD